MLVDNFKCVFCDGRNIKDDMKSKILNISKIQYFGVEYS